jgi:glutamyl-tRNA reductase
MHSQEDHPGAASISRAGLVASDEPWVLGARADTADAAERAGLARAVMILIEQQPNWILLDTCHRAELYGFGPPPDFGERVRFVSGAEAVKHLMRVAAGLDSAIVGEDEVLHQVRSALSVALAAKDLDRRLQRLFEMAIAAGRRARAGRTATGGSLAQRAVGWLQQRSPLAGQSVLIAGAGRMGSALAHCATRSGATIVVASRDAARARRLAQVHGGIGVDLATGARLIHDSVGVAVALAGQWDELKLATGELPPIADLSAPTAIPASVRDRLDGNYLNIDDLYVRSDLIPSGYIEQAARLVETKSAEYLAWLARA